MDDNGYQIEFRRIKTELKEEIKRAKKDYETALVHVEISDDPQRLRIKNYYLGVLVGLEKVENIINEPKEKGQLNDAQKRY